ncbi:MAG: type I 3-dehydroquinate dehydratase [Chthoniobacterales bacterium]
MITRPAGKGSRCLVGVIADRAALAKATRLRTQPDFFELRLDALADSLAETESALPQLGAPLICTARHPAEGGAHDLSTKKRMELLRRFLPHATFLDIELRSAAAMAPLLAEAKRATVAVLLSSHHLRDTPETAALREELEAALAFQPKIFKIATRTDHAAQLDRLVTFFVENSARIPLAAMGMGRQGRASRRQLLRLGSALNYAALGAANVPGQPTLPELRRTRDAYYL